MNKFNSFYTVYLSIFFFIVSVIAFAINTHIYQYPGNNYFPPHTQLIELILVLIYAGCYLQYGVNSRLTQITQEIIFFFLVMSVLITATNAVQYTPFPPIDKQIITSWETWLPQNCERKLIHWTHAHPLIKVYLESIYISLAYQMTYLPLIIIIFGYTARIREHYFLLLITALLGYGFYYFFPTTAPASMIDSPHFSDIQQATGIKFNQIHQYIQPTTLEGGMVAFPSFHVIWGWLCVYLVRGWSLAFMLLLLINLSLVASCVLLGWHYPVDVLGSLVVILFGHLVYARCRRS